MKLAAAQIKCTVGDLGANVRKILDYTNQARELGASLIVTPELAISGYPPEDLLLRPGFVSACADALAGLAKEVTGIAVVVGHPHYGAGELHNAASVIYEGKIIATYLKNLLPNESVFDEKRYFKPGSAPCVFELHGKKFGVNICQDIWEPGPVTHAKN